MGEAVAVAVKLNDSYDVEKAGSVEGPFKTTSTGEFLFNNQELNSYYGREMAWPGSSGVI